MPYAAGPWESQLCTFWKIQKQLEIVLNRVGESMDRFLNSFSADGACLEGLSYWTYGMSFFVSYCELLYRRSGGQVDLMASERGASDRSFSAAVLFSWRQNHQLFRWFDTGSFLSGSYLVPAPILWRYCDTAKGLYGFIYRRFVLSLGYAVPGSDLE